MINPAQPSAAATLLDLTDSASSYEVSERKMWVKTIRATTPAAQAAAVVDGYGAAFMAGAALMLAGAAAIAAILRRRHVEAIDADPATIPVAG